jgi:hypothetical protein
LKQSILQVGNLQNSEEHHNWRGPYYISTLEKGMIEEGEVERD